MAAINFIPVSSSNIAAVGYDTDVQDLYVRFKTGATYKYAGVPQDEYESLLSASSVGQAFQSDIKDVYPFQRV